MKIAPPTVPGRILGGYGEMTSADDEYVRPHGVEDWLLLAGVSGRGTLLADGKTFPLERGSFYLYLPRTRHHQSLSPESTTVKFVFVHFIPRSEWLPLLRWDEIARGLRFQRVKDAPILQRILASLDDVVQCAQTRTYLRDMLTANALEKSLLVLETQFREAHWPGVDTRLRKLLVGVEQHLEGKWSLTEMAAVAGISVPRIVQLFRQQVGMPPRRYLEFCRVKKAAELLISTDSTISEISAVVGFENPFYFSTRFKQCLGVPPSVYRIHYRCDHKL